MKIRFIITAAVCLSTLGVAAQDSKFEIIPGYGYTFNGSGGYSYGEIDVDDNYSMSLALDVRVMENKLIELSYLSNPTDMNAVVYNGILGATKYNTPLSVEYYHIGAINEFSNGKARPFAGVSLGGTRFHPTGETTSTEGSALPTYASYSDVWAFSATLYGGAKIMFNDRIGLRLMGRLMMPMYFSGVGIYCGGGCGGGASFGVYFLQLDLTGGLIIALGSY